jgi:hypothetical protein
MEDNKRRKKKKNIYTMHVFTPLAISTAVVKQCSLPPVA